MSLFPGTCGYNRIGAALAKLLQPHSDLGRAQPRIALQVIESLLSPTFAEQEGAELDYKVEPAALWCPRLWQGEAGPRGTQCWYFRPLGQ